MRNRVLMSLLVIGLAAALVGGATMAWFTDADKTKKAKFTAGTVRVTTEGGINELGNLKIDNWNPGDTEDVMIKVCNTGSKNIVFRLHPKVAWENGDLSLENITLDGDCGDNWKRAFDDPDPNNWYLYYVGDPIGKDECVELSFQITIDGEQTGNEYQGKTLTLTGFVEAIQSSNDAPNLEWGVQHYNYLKDQGQ